MEREIDFLRMKLYTLVKEDATFQEIYDVSIMLDSLIVVYYRGLAGEMNLKEEKQAV